MNKESTPTPDPLLVDVHAVAQMLGCGWRLVYRLVDSGAMPNKLKVGRLSRWNRAEIENWIANGCPPCRRGGGR